ncbi:hypothetical protein [Spirosoma koreense]
MKRLVFGFSLLVLGLVGCRKDQDVDPDLLYRTWQLTKMTTLDGKPVTITANPSNILTFRSNGTILYGADGRYAICCNPIVFNRKDSVLDFKDVASITIPDDVPRADCSAVSCVMMDDHWTITTLTSTQLVVFGNNRGIAVFQPYP